VGGALHPDRGRVDFDTTGNVVIEGDNLEVLKLLQKAYHPGCRRIPKAVACRLSR
jgi:adenine-specific DNA-methyltransferase